MSRIALRLIATICAAGALASFGQEARATSCVSGPWILFFDLDDDQLSAESAATLEKTAEAYRVCGFGGHLFLAGHSDRAGPGAYNMALARRRAESVRAALLRHGIPPGVLIVEVLGEKRTLVDTADGVPEAQNRRVEIILGPPGGW
jgi:outer membrane protein OmpA-like peptidoglycan-associated protein